MEEKIETKNGGKTKKKMTKRMNLERDIPLMENKLKASNEKLDKLFDQLSKLLPTVRDKDGCVLPAVWTKISALKARISTIAFDMQDLPLDILKYKRIANMMARKAFLKEVTLRPQTKWVPPYPEVRGK